MPYIIRAEIDATDDMPGMFAREWFECGVINQSISSCTFLLTGRISSDSEGR